MAKESTYIACIYIFGSYCKLLWLSKIAVSSKLGRRLFVWSTI